MKVGFIGIGNIGGRLAPRLIEAGHELFVNDLRREAAGALIERGATWCESPRAVGESSDVVFTSVPGPSDVEKVLLTPETGLVNGLSNGKVFIDLTTSYPEMSRRLAAACRERGAEMLDCPVSNGGAFMSVGGDRAAFDRCLPVMEAICGSGHVFYMGESGMGNVAKLVRQYQGFVNFWTYVEALMIGKKAGADVSAVIEFISATRGGPMPGANWIDGMLEGAFDASPGSSALLDIVAKDVSLAIELARQVGAPALTGLGADDIMKRGQARGLSRKQFFAAVQVLEEMAGERLTR
jgi:3-hydroxyisobutyrate dehydrogenase-like beta-hydroxyacid dehydrogenase